MVYKFIVSGKVQGVWYRKYVSENAKKAGFKGYVKNLTDGNVEAVAVIENEEELNRFLEILKEGSPFSKVEKIDIIPLENELVFNEFSIKY